MRVSCLITTLLVVNAIAQSNPKTTPLEFEVASVKTEPPPSMGALPTVRGGPGTGEPGRIHYSGVTLMTLLTKAYGMYPDQIFGAKWLISEMYTVDAVVPARATKEQFAQMLGNLLVKRFKLVLEPGEREFTVYNLVVANGGSKLRSSPSAEIVTDASTAESLALPAAQLSLDNDGCPVLRPGTRGVIGSVGASNCTAFRRYSTSDLAKALEMFVAIETGNYYGPQASQAHILDRTGLRGEFDFNLKFTLHSRSGGMAPGMPIPSGESDPGGGSLFTALEKQLGLKLEKAKSRLPVLVIQQASRVPTEN